MLRVLRQGNRGIKFFIQGIMFGRAKPELYSSCLFASPVEQLSAQFSPVGVNLFGPQNKNSVKTEGHRNSGSTVQI